MVGLIYGQTAYFKGALSLQIFYTVFIKGENAGRIDIPKEVFLYSESRFRLLPVATVELGSGA